MTRQAHHFVNTAGEKIELLCDVELSHGYKIYKQVFLPEGKAIKPNFLRGNEYIYIYYKQDRWFLLS